MLTVRVGKPDYHELVARCLLLQDNKDLPDLILAPKNLGLPGKNEELFHAKHNGALDWRIIYSIVSRNGRKKMEVIHHGVIEMTEFTEVQM